MTSATIPKARLTVEVTCEGCGRDGTLPAKPEYHVYCGDCIRKAQAKGRMLYLGRR